MKASGIYIHMNIPTVHTHRELQAHTSRETSINRYVKPTDMLTQTPGRRWMDGRSVWCVADEGCLSRQLPIMLYHEQGPSS